MTLKEFSAAQYAGITRELVDGEVEWVPTPQIKFFQMSFDSVFRAGKRELRQLWVGSHKDEIVGREWRKVEIDSNGFYDY